MIARQSFEQAPEDSWAYTAVPPPYNTENDAMVNGDEDVWSRIISFSGDIDQAFSGNWFWGMQDLDNPSGGGNFIHTLVFDPINTTGFEDLIIRLAINCREWDTGDQLSMVLCLDGIAQSEQLLFVGQGDTSTAGWELLEFPVAGYHSSLALEIKAFQNGSSDYGGIDAVTLIGTESAPCALEITSVDPMCEDLAQVGLDIHFTIQEKGPSNQYYISTGNDSFGPFEYLAGSDQHRYISDIPSQPGGCELIVFDTDAPPAGSLRINEVLYDVPTGALGDANQDGVTNSSEDEFVEITNFTGIPIDLSGWSLYDNSGSQPRHVFPVGTVLGHREALIVFGGGSPPAQINSSIVQVASSGSLSLNNVSSGGDLLGLYEDANGTLLHTFCDWTSGFSDVNESINLNPDITGTNYTYHGEANEDDLIFSPGTGINGMEWQWPVSCVDAAVIDIPDCCQSHLYFRTIQSGNWENISNWEVSQNGLSDWKPACTIPGKSSDQIISISTNTEIMLSDSAVIGSLTIATGSSLAIGQGVMVVHNKSSGPDLLVEGELQDHSNSQNGIKFTGNSSWELAAGATIVKTGNSTGTGLRDQYHDGIGNIPSSSYWIYRYEGGSTTPSVISVGMVYPNLSFENNAGGVYEPGIGNGYFQGGSGSVRIKGDLVIGGSSGGAYTVRNCNFSPEPMVIEGDLLLGPGSILTNEKPPCCPDLISIKEGTGYQFEGDLHISENALLSLRKEDSGDDNENSQARVCWIAGSVDQQLNGTGIIDVDHWGMMTTGSRLAVNRNLSVREKLELITGTIDMTGHTFVMLSDAPAAITGYAPGGLDGPSYIFNGTLERGVQYSGIYDFPLGSELNYQLLSLELGSSNVGKISATFFTTSGGYMSILEEDYGYSELLNNGHWSIGPSAGQPEFEGVYNISLFGRGYTNPGSPCAALKTEDGVWQNNPSGSSTPDDCTISAGFVNAVRNNATTFSKHGIGVNGILPLTDLSLVAEVKDPGEVVLTGAWQGEADQEGMHFKLYRGSRNTMGGLIYSSQLDPVSGNNKIEIQDYPPASGFIIYTLELFNGAGQLIESTMESILIPENRNCTFYPNPASNIIRTTCMTGDEIMLNAYNCEGKNYTLVRTGENSFNVSHLERGIYWIQWNGKVIKFAKL